MSILRTLILAGVLTIPYGGQAEPAQAAPAFGWPFSGTYNMTAAYDLDRVNGPQADWTGWRSGEVTAGSGHAYNDHTGTDSGMGTNTDLFATAAGRVWALREIVPNDDHSDTGNYLIIDHTSASGTAVGGRNYRTRYWHLAQNGVLPSGTGVMVAKGQHVAKSDNTGNSTGPHLHYAISLLPGDVSTCPYYHAWWENDEFYTANNRPCIVYLNTGNAVLNCRDGVGTNYGILTTFPPNTQVVATQRNTWWRVQLPLPPATAKEALHGSGGLASGYSDSGQWSNLAQKSSVQDPVGDANRVVLGGSGSRSTSTDGNPSDTATFAFTMPYQKGSYDVYATWPSSANARNVSYRITHAGGVSSVLVDQRGQFGSMGTGTKASPYIINQNPYVVNHTTVGAQDEWQIYSPQGSSLPQEGPENLYRIDLPKAGTITVTVDHTGYPTKDIDIHLLTSPSPTTCIQRADWTFTSSVLAAGTYYIACDSYGSGAAGNAAATNYTLRVTFNEDQPFPNSWVKLGTYNFEAGAQAQVQVLKSTVSGPLNASQPGRVVADSIKIVPRLTRRTGWISDSIATRINTAQTPVPSVVIKTDKTANFDSNSIDAFAEVPIYASPGTGTTNSSAIVGKAFTGQRFVCNYRNGDWYQVDLTNGTAATKGWILGNHLIGYHLNLTSSAENWPLY